MSAKHVSPGQSTFARDLAIMVGGIIVVAVLVFGGLWLVSNLGDDDGSDVTTSTAVTTTTIPTTTLPETTTTTVGTTTTTSTQPTTTVQQARDPSEVTVLVLNSIGAQGLAGRVTTRLEEAGYQTLTPDNYTPPLEQTQVWFTEGFGPEAFDLAAFFPDAEVARIQEPAPPGADVVVVLGASYEE